MAFTGYSRFALSICAVVATIAMTAPTSAATDHTYAGTAPNWGNVILLDVGNAYVDHAFDIAPLAIFKDQRSVQSKRGYQAYKPLALNERASRAAVRPTSAAGWGSGRLRRLAG